MKLSNNSYFKAQKGAIIVEYMVLLVFVCLSIGYSLGYTSLSEVFGGDINVATVKESKITIGADTDDVANAPRTIRKAPVFENLPTVKDNNNTLNTNNMIVASYFDSTGGGKNSQSLINGVKVNYWIHQNQDWFGSVVPFSWRYFQSKSNDVITKTLIWSDFSWDYFPDTVVPVIVMVNNYASDDETPNEDNTVYYVALVGIISKGEAEVNTTSAYKWLRDNRYNPDWQKEIEKWLEYNSPQGSGGELLSNGNRLLVDATSGYMYGLYHAYEWTHSSSLKPVYNHRTAFNWSMRNGSLAAQVVNYFKKNDDGSITYGLSGQTRNKVEYTSDVFTNSKNANNQTTFYYKPQDGARSYDDACLVYKALKKRMLLQAWTYKAYDYENVYCDIGTDGIVNYIPQQHYVANNDRISSIEKSNINIGKNPFYYSMDDKYAMVYKFGEDDIKYHGYQLTIKGDGYLTYQDSTRFSISYVDNTTNKVVADSELDVHSHYYEIVPIIRTQYFNPNKLDESKLVEGSFCQYTKKAGTIYTWQDIIDKALKKDLNKDIDKDSEKIIVKDDVEKTIVFNMNLLGSRFDKKTENSVSVVEGLYRYLLTKTGDPNKYYYRLPYCIVTDYDEHGYNKSDGAINGIVNMLNLDCPSKGDVNIGNVYFSNIDENNIDKNTHPLLEGYSLFNAQRSYKDFMDDYAIESDNEFVYNREFVKPVVEEKSEAEKKAIRQNYYLSLIFGNKTDYSGVDRIDNVQSQNQTWTNDIQNYLDLMGGAEYFGSRYSWRFVDDVDYRYIVITPGKVWNDDADKNRCFCADGVIIKCYKKNIENLGDPDNNCLSYYVGKVGIRTTSALILTKAQAEKSSANNPAGTLFFSWDGNNKNMYTYGGYYVVEENGELTWGTNNGGNKGNGKSDVDKAYDFKSLASAIAFINAQKNS